MLSSEKASILYMTTLTLLHSERPKLYKVLAILSAIGLRGCHYGIRPLKSYGYSEHSNQPAQNMQSDQSYNFFTFLDFEGFLNGS